MDADETLASEARRRPRAAAAALGAALLILGSFILQATLFADRPSTGLLDGLELAARPGAVDGAQSLRIPVLEFYSDRIGGLIGASVLRGLGYVLVGLALGFLAAATRTRSDRFPRFAALLPPVGGVLFGLSTALAGIGTATDIERVLDGSRTVDAVSEIGRGSVSIAAQIVGLPGTLAVALAFVLVCLNAMRVGLLTRFMGVLGMLAGALFVIPLGGDLPVVQCFWLAALGVLFLGRWPGGAPAAWRTGRAEPWPTQQELREARARARGGSERPAPEPEPVAAVSGTGGARDASAKRKRKRRS